LFVHRGDELGALAVSGDDPPAQVHLVTVVLRRIVGGGHHHSGVGTERADGVGEYRGGAVLVEQVHLPARTGDDPGGILGELTGAVAGIEPDGDRRARPADRLGEEGGEARGGPGDDGAVHPGRPAPERPAQPGGAELQQPGEAVGEFRRCALVPGFGAREQAREFRRGAGVGVVVDPRAYLRVQGVGHYATAFVTIELNSCASRASAAFPAATTSSCASGIGEIPAARFVTSDIPNTSSPASRAAIASSAVDMPTRSAPSTLAICTSAGVS